ncbi:MAG: porin [Thalassobaculum sp.]
MNKPVGFAWRHPVGIAASVLAAVSIAASADAAEKLSVGIGGEYTQYFGYADNDTSTGDFNGFDVKTDGTLTFGGETTLDNGVSFGVEVGLDAQSSGDDQIDGSMLYLESSAGRLEVGQTDTVAALMHYSAPDVGYGINDSDISDWVVNLSGGDANSAFQSTYLYLGEDQATKINYFTPRSSPDSSSGSPTFRSSSGTATFSRQATSTATASRSAPTTFKAWALSRWRSPPATSSPTSRTVSEPAEATPRDTASART